MPSLVAVQLVWDSSELGNLQKKKITVQVNDKSLLKTYFVLKLPPSPQSPSRVFKIYHGSK